MAKQSINALKNWFRTGLKPTQSQFWDWLESFWHKDDKIPVGSVWITDATSLETYLNTLPSAEQLAIIAALVNVESHEKTEGWNWQLNANTLWEGVVIEAPENVDITFLSAGRELVFSCIANSPEMHRVDIFNTANEIFAVSGLPVGTTKFKFYKK